MPVAVTLKLAVWPTSTVTLAGCPVMLGATGAGLTLSVAGVLVADPAALLTRTLNCAPLSASAVLAIV